MQADAHQLFEYPPRKPVEAKLLKEQLRCVTIIYVFPEMHADLFSRHANSLEVYVFVAVANRGEDVMSDAICRRFNGKQQ